MKAEALFKGKLEVAKARSACKQDAKVAKQIAPYQKMMESYGVATSICLLCGFNIDS